MGLSGKWASSPVRGPQTLPPTRTTLVIVVLRASSNRRVIVDQAAELSMRVSGGETIVRKAA